LVQGGFSKISNTLSPKCTLEFLDYGLTVGLRCAFIRISFFAVWSVSKLTKLQNGPFLTLYKKSWCQK